MYWMQFLSCPSIFLYVYRSFKQETFWGFFCYRWATFGTRPTQFLPFYYCIGEFMLFVCVLIYLAMHWYLYIMSTFCLERCCRAQLFFQLLLFLIVLWDPLNVRELGKSWVGYPFPCSGRNGEEFKNWSFMCIHVGGCCPISWEWRQK